MKNIIIIAILILFVFCNTSLAGNDEAAQELGGKPPHAKVIQYYADYK